ncbi:Ribosomal protein L18e/L15P, partial [Trinorchestia longiramus]
GRRIKGTENKGPKHHNRHVPAGYENEEQSPYFLRFPIQKWAKARYDISYVPLTLKFLQYMVDVGRLDPSIPVDITQLSNTSFARIDTRLEHGGIMLEEEGMDCFCTPMNLEVQFASEAAIAAVERAGGTITTAYYDPYSLSAALKPIEFFKKGEVNSSSSSRKVKSTHRVLQER